MANNLSLAQLDELFSTLNLSDKHDPCSSETKSKVFLVLNHDKDKKTWNLNNGFKFNAKDVVDKALLPEPFDLIKGKVEANFVKQVVPSRKSKITGTISKCASKNDDIGQVNDHIFFNAQHFLNKKFKKGDLVECNVVGTKFESFLWRATSIRLIKKNSFFCTYTSKHNSNKETYFATRKNIKSLQPAFVKRKNNLPLYLVPENLESSVKNKTNFTKHPELLEDLFEENYVARFSALLYISEKTERSIIKAVKVPNIKITPLKDSKNVFEIKYADIIAQYGTIRNKEYLRITKQGQSLENHVHFGTVQEIDKSTGTIHVRFNKKKLDTLRPTDQFVMSFSFNRIAFERAHRGIKLAYSNRKDILFPKEVKKEGECINRGMEKECKFYNTNLNERQRAAVVNIQSSCTNHAYILIGPPGTGKTVTLTELIVQLLRKDTNSRLLVCASSNNAVDNICLKLLKSEQVDGGLFTRLNSPSRPKDQLPKELLTYCWNGVCFRDMFKYVFYIFIF